MSVSRAALERLSGEISQLINDELREIEAEDLAGPGDGLVPALAVVPEMAYAYLGEDRTLSVLARSDVAVAGETVEIALDPVGVLEQVASAAILGPHSRRTDVLTAQVRLRPLVEDDSAMVTATLGDRSAVAIVEVRGARLILEEPAIPPETLEFGRTAYRVGWQRGKNLEIAAPAELVAGRGSVVAVSSSAPGVVVRTPTVQLTFDEDLSYYRATARVEGRTLGVTASVTAGSRRDPSIHARDRHTQGGGTPLPDPPRGRRLRYLPCTERDRGRSRHRRRGSAVEDIWATPSAQAGADAVHRQFASGPARDRRGGGRRRGPACSDPAVSVAPGVGGIHSRPDLRGALPSGGEDPPHCTAVAALGP